MANTNNNQNEQGFVSLVVALTLIIILALLTVGFAQLSRREQRSALDKNLSTQAYYAAETGINDVTQAYYAGSIPTSNDPTKCLTTLPNSVINSSANVAYTCELVDLKPDNLLYTNVGPEVDHKSSFTAVDQSGNPTTLSSLTITWDSPGRTGLPSGTNTGFLPFGQWNSSLYPSVIEFSVDRYDRTAITQSDLMNGLFTTYLYPTSSGGSTTYGTANNGSITAATCSSGSCSVTINGLDVGGPATPGYLIHFLPRYATSNITITGKDPLGNKIDFLGGQIMIDSTGKAQDVLKRIQVRVDPKNQGKLPKFAVEAENICKREATEPSSTSFITASGGTTNDPNNPCFLSN